MRFKPFLPASSAAAFLAGAALFLSSCLPGAEFNVTVRLEDEATGKPIPNALVLAGAYLEIEPPFDPPHPAVGAARAMSDVAGVVRFTRTEGMYEGEKPQDPLWKMLDARKPVVKRKIRAMEGGSILVFASGYGLVEQPFMIQGKPNTRSGRIGSWLGGAKGESWLKEPLTLQAGELVKGREITIKLAKPRDPDFQFASFALDVLANAAVLVSRDTGATAREKSRIYDFFKGQIEYAASVSDDPFYQRQLDKFKDPKTKDWLMLQHKMERNHDPVLHLWLAEKSLELLPREYDEVKKYAFAVKDGLQTENDATLEAYHYYNPENPDTGFWNKDTALQWGAIGYPDNPRNDWDWQDALRYYRQGDKQKAYQALGHVLYLLQNMSVPMHTHKISHSSGREAARYETYFAELAHQNNDVLPPIYSEDAGSPRRLKQLRGYFDAVALRTFDDFVADGKPVSFGDYYAWHPDAEGELSRQPDDQTLELMGRHVFPVEIEYGAGLLEQFYDTLHPAASAENTQTATDAAAQQSQDAGKGNAKPSPTMPDILKKDHPDNPKDIDDLVAIVRSDDKETRGQAAMKLSDPDPKAKAALKDKYLALLDDKHAPVRRAAMLGCGKLNIRESIPTIRAVLKSTPKSIFGAMAQHGLNVGESYSDAMIATQALGNLKDVDSVPIILDRDALDVSWGVVLPPFGPKALPIIVERYRGAAKDKKLMYLRAITDFNTPENTAQLEELLKDNDSEIRTSALIALGQIAAVGTWKHDPAAEQAVRALQENYDNLDDTGKDYYFDYCAPAHCDIEKNIARARQFLIDHDYILAGNGFMIGGLCETGNQKLIPFMREVLHGPDPMQSLHPKAHGAQLNRR